MTKFSSRIMVQKALILDNWLMNNRELFTRKQPFNLFKSEERVHQTLKLRLLSVHVIGVFSTQSLSKIHQKNGNFPGFKMV